MPEHLGIKLIYSKTALGIAVESPQRAVALAGAQSEDLQRKARAAGNAIISG